MGPPRSRPPSRMRPPAVQACPRAVTACQKGTPRMRSAAASRTSRSTRCALTRKGPSLHEGSMRTIDILSPVALGPAQAKALAPRLPTLRGKVLGIRVDRAWRSFHVYADELGRLARERLRDADGVVFHPETRIGTPQAESGKEVKVARHSDS